MNKLPHAFITFNKIAQETCFIFSESLQLAAVFDMTDLIFHKFQHAKFSSVELLELDRRIHQITSDDLKERPFSVERIIEVGSKILGTITSAESSKPICIDLSFDAADEFIEIYENWLSQSDLTGRYFSEKLDQLAKIIFQIKENKKSKGSLDKQIDQYASQAFELCSKHLNLDSCFELEQAICMGELILQDFEKFAAASSKEAKHPMIEDFFKTYIDNLSKEEKDHISDLLSLLEKTDPSLELKRLDEYETIFYSSPKFEELLNSKDNLAIPSAIASIIVKDFPIAAPSEVLPYSFTYLRMELKKQAEKLEKGAHYHNAFVAFGNLKKHLLFFIQKPDFQIKTNPHSLFELIHSYSRAGVIDRSIFYRLMSTVEQKCFSGEILKIQFQYIQVGIAFSYAKFFATLEGLGLYKVEDEHYKIIAKKFTHHLLQNIDPNSLNETQIRLIQQASLFFDLIPFKVAIAQESVTISKFHEEVGSCLQEIAPGIFHGEQELGAFFANYSADFISLNEKGQIAIVIEVDGPTHFWTRGIHPPIERLPSPATFLRNAIYQKKECKLISIPFFEWNGKTKDQKISYLKSLLLIG